MTSEAVETDHDQPQDEDAEDDEEDEGKEEDDAPTFDDLLAKQVQRFEYLYDKTHEYYGNNKKRHEAWILVGKALEKPGLFVLSCASTRGLFLSTKTVPYRPRVAGTDQDQD